MAEPDEQPVAISRPHWGVSVSVAGVVAAVAFIVSFQNSVATQDDIDDLRNDHASDQQEIARRLDGIDADGTRGLAELRGELEALKARTDDRFRGSDWAAQNARLDEKFRYLERENEQLSDEVDRLRGFVVDLNERIRYGGGSNGTHDRHP